MPVAVGQLRPKEFGQAVPVLQVIYSELLGVPDPLQIGVDLGRSVGLATVILEIRIGHEVKREASLNRKLREGYVSAGISNHA